jgi:predicted ester cyclase
MGVAPTGNAVSARGIEILRIADGCVAECWISFDGLALLQQIGAVRVPGQAAP